MDKDSNDFASIDLDMSDAEVDEVQIKGSTRSSPSRSKKGIELRNERKLKSPVWLHFEILPRKNPDDEEKCRCKKCGRTYLSGSKNGTGNMKRHLKTCVKTNTRDIGQLILSQSSGSTSLRAPNFNQIEWRELVAMTIVMHDLPFVFVEYEGIRRMLRYLCPDVQFITRNTAKADVMKMFKTEKTRLLHLLKECPGRVSLTADL